MAVTTTKTNPTNNNLPTTILLPFIIAISLILTYQNIKNKATYTKTKTLATIGKGNINITSTNKKDKANSQKALSQTNQDIAKTTKDIYSVKRDQGSIDATLDNRLLTKDGHKAIKEDFKRNEILVKSVADVTNKGVGLTKNQKDGKTGLLDHIDEDQKYFSATKKFVNDPINKVNVAILNNPNATPEQKQQAYSALANYISKEMGVSPAKAKLMVDSQYKGAFHKNGKAGTIYINDLAQENSANAVNTVGHETTHSIDYQKDKDIAKTKNYETNRESHAVLMGEHTQDYMEYQYADNGYDSLKSTTNNNIGTNYYNGLDKTVVKNTEDFSKIDSKDLDYSKARNGASSPAQELINMNANSLIRSIREKNPSFSLMKNRDAQGNTQYTNKDIEYLKTTLRELEREEIHEHLKEKYGAHRVTKYSIDEVTGVPTVETTAGTTSGWNKFLNQEVQEPNTIYKVRTQVGETEFKTDELGRVEEVSYNVENKTVNRNNYQQRKAGRTKGIKNGQENDQGGHFQPAAHGGPGEQINLAPQNGSLNNGEYKILENTWTKAVAEGKNVEVKIKPIYEGSSRRPSEYKVKYTIDGEEHYENFSNKGK